MEPLAIEVKTDGGLTVRGQEWTVQGPPIVMVHDHGDDLDSWRGIDHLLADQGFRVINLDLPNHGLSDELDDDRPIVESVTEILKSVSGVWGPVGLCSYGSISTDLAQLRGQDGPVTHVMVSPRGTVDSGCSQPNAGQEVPQLVIAATNDGERSDEARAVFDGLGTRKLWASVAATDHGPALIRSRTHLLDDIAIFFRRTLVSAHLAWTASTHEEAAAEFRNTELEGE